MPPSSFSSHTKSYKLTHYITSHIFNILHLIHFYTTSPHPLHYLIHCITSSITLPRTFCNTAYPHSIAYLLHFIIFFQRLFSLRLCVLSSNRLATCFAVNVIHFSQSVQFSKLDIWWRLQPQTEKPDVPKQKLMTLYIHHFCTKWTLIALSLH